MLPWLTAHVDEARALMGEDYWPYGFAANRHVLDTFLRYHHEQGLSSAASRQKSSSPAKRSDRGHPCTTHR
jgi:hypothetical protein